jgi:thiol:disulfide interchange protein DsbC
MMLRKIATLVLVTGGFTAGAALASEAAIRQAFKSKIPEMTVESVGKTPMAGLYEVVANGQIFYVDEKVTVVIRGVLFDARTPAMRNLTSERNAELAAALLRKSTDAAIKRVRGNGKRVLYTFEDPNCGYCRQLQKELLKLNDVTIYTFLWPILSQDSVEKSKAVWCARDRARAWDDLMTSGVAPQNDAKCENPLEKNLGLAQRFGIRGTPAVFTADGRSIGGFVEAAKIEEAFRTPIASK